VGRRGGQRLRRVFNVAAIFELEAGKIRRDTRYYAEPFEASEERAEWFERMER
jgi:hypothetical protein